MFPQKARLEVAILEMTRFLEDLFSSFVLLRGTLLFAGKIWEIASEHLLQLIIKMVKDANATHDEFAPKWRLSGPM